jgi:uncharacterized protein with PQ loop repeat
MEHLISFAEENELFKEIVGWTGNVLALFFFVTPMLAMYNLMKGIISSKDVSYFMFIANILNCVLWFIIGIFLEDITIWGCNGLGAVLNIIYLLIFWLYFVEKNILKYFLYLFLTIGGIAALFSSFYFGAGKENNETTKYVAMVFNILMYAAPCQKLVNL